MSWYNSTDNNFIDATQTFENSGVSGGDLIVNEGDETTNNLGFNSKITDLIKLKFEDGIFNLYLQNLNENGLIYLNTSGNDNKVKIENGKLYLYYDYDFTNAPTITGGWTDIVSYSVANKNQLITLAVNVGVIDTTLYAPVTGLTIRMPLVETLVATATSINIEQDARLTVLEGDVGLGEITQLELNNALDSGLDQLRDELGENAHNFLDAIRNAGYEGGNSLNLAANIAASRTNFLANIFTNILGALGGFSLGIVVIFGIYDRLTEKGLIDEEEKLLITYEKIKDESGSLINNLIHLNGLQINELTNTGFITSGTYDVNIINGAKLKIEIKNIDNELKALILEVLSTTTGFNVNDIITIPKSNLGGGTGSLEITVISLINERELIAQKLNNILIKKNIIKNNDRRRLNIPNKNDFTDGLEIVESTTTEESGEVLPKIEIKLKLDENHFEYDVDGNLQVKNYTIISDNAGDITTIQNTIGTTEDTKETATIYGNIAKNVYDIDLLENNVIYKNYITDFGANSKFQLTPIYDENNNIINYQLDSSLLGYVSSALGTRSPQDTETAFEKIATNKTDISGIRTDLTTQTERIDDIRLVLGYDDNSILYLLLPKNDIGETPSIETNLAQNKGLLDIGYKTNDLAYNYDDYFDVLFIIPKFNKSIFNTTNEFQENMVNNNYVLTTNNFSIITDYNNFTSEISGTISFTLPNTDYLGVSFYANLYNQQVLRAILGYKNLSVDMKQDLIVITYTANEVNFRTILDTSFSTGLQISSTNDLLLGQTFTEHKLTSDDTLINGIYIINDATENISYSSPYDIFTTSLGLSGGYDIYNTSAIQASNDAFLVEFADDVTIKDLNIDVSRTWIYSGISQQPYEPYVKINIYIGNTLQEALDKTTQILSNNFTSLGSTQYQSVTTFNIANTNQNISCRYLYFTIEHQPHVRDTYPLKVSFLSINSQYSYNTITYLTQEASINIPNQECHFVINRDDVARRLNLYVDGVLTSLYYPLILFTDDYVLTMGNDLALYTFRMLGINNTNINPADFANIKLLNDTTRSVNIDRLTTIEDLYVKDNLVCKNLEVINDSGNVLSFREEISGGRRRGLISDTTYTLLDEVIIPNAPTENAFLYYDTTTANINTRSDVVLDSDLTAYQLKTEAFSGNYSDLINPPTLFNNDYNSLDNLPTLFNGDYNSLANLPTLFNGDYNSLNNLPTLFNGDYNSLNNLPTLFDGDYNSLDNLPTLFDNDYNSLDNLPTLFSGNYSDLINPPTLFSGNYSDLINPPTLFDGDYNSLDNLPNLSFGVGDINGLQDALDAKAGLDHNHTIANVFGLQSALDGKALSSHGHVISDIVDLQARLNEKALVTDLSGKADALHTHFAEDITDLQSKLNLYKLNTDFNQDVSDIIQADLPTYAGDYLSYIQSTNKLQVDITLLLENTDYTIIPGLESAIENAGSGGSSVWTQNDNKIYYNLGNVGIGNLNPYYKTHIKADFTDNTLKGSSLAVEGNSDSYLWALSRNTTGTATLGLMTDYQAFDETTNTGNATGLVITYFNQPTFKGASFQIANNEFIQMNQETNRIDINNKNLYLDSYEVLPYQTTREQILLYIGDKQNDINYTTKGGTVSLYNGTNTGGGTFTVDENKDLNLTLEYDDTGFSIKKFNGTTTQNIFYIDENICYINDTILSRTATEPPIDYLLDFFGNTLSGTFNRRSDITTDITGAPSVSSIDYVIFENAIQVKEIIFTDDPTFRFKSKTELRDAIITLDPNISLMYDENGNLKVTDGAVYSDTKVINLLQSAFGDYLDFNPETVSADVNILQVSQAIDYNDIPNLADAIANAGGVPTGTTNNILFYDAHLGEFKNDNNFINVTMDFKKKRYDQYNGVETESHDLLTIGEDPLTPNVGLIDLKLGSMRAFQMNIQDRIDFEKTIEFNGNTYILGGGTIENVWDGGNLYTNFSGHSAVFDNALIKKLTVNDFDVKGTIGLFNSAIPTRIAESSQTTLRRTYGSSLDTEEAVYSTYYNKYTNDIEVYGIIFQDNTYIGSAQDIKDAISITDYALQSELNTTNANVADNASGIANNLSNVTAALSQIAALTATVNTNTTNISTNTSDITALDTRLTTEENKDHFVNGNEILNVGTGTSSSETPTINLIGANFQGVSSKIVFADNNASGELNNGMIIYYDSSFNRLNISADENADNIIDTPPAMTFNRSNRYVGIQNTNPLYMLDVNGNVNTTGNYYTNGVSLNNLVNDNSADITALDTRLTTQENRAYFPIHPSIGYDVDAPDNTIYIKNISGNGSVGINKTDCLFPLDVGGTIRANSILSETGISAANLNMNSSSTDAIMRINASEPNKAIIKLATPFNGSFGYKSNVALQAIGRSSWGKSDFVVGVSNVNNNSTTYEPLDTYYQRMRIPCDSFTQFFGTFGSGSLGAYYYGYGSTGSYYTMSWNVCTKHSGVVWATSYFINSSDRDIKKDIEELKDDECLKKILLLRPSKYRYIDETKNVTPNKTYGYIAQEVAEVLPEAVRYQAEYIPNALCFVNINNDIITIDNIRPDTYTLILSVGLKIKLFDDIDNEILVEITEVIDENTFKVNQELKYEKLFLYGSLKEDFATLAKEYINAVHVSATQELHRIIKKQENRINELEEKLNNVLKYLEL